MKKNAPLSLLLCLCLTLSSPALLASCSESTDNAASDPAVSETSAEAVSAVEAEPEEEMTVQKVRELYSDRNFDGYVYRIADRSDGWWGTVDVYSEEITGEVINDAVYNRNTLMEDAYHMKLEEYRVGDVSGTIRSTVTAHSDDYSVFTDGLNKVGPLVSSGYVLDWRTIDTVKPENDWWDHQLYEDLSIAGKTYMMTGDISIMDNYGTWCYLFNKTTVSDYQMENPYELVESGKWTVDKHNEMADIATNDLNGDGRWTDADFYGFITENYNTMALWTCFGYRLFDKDENDLPYLSFNEETKVDALMKAIETQQGKFTNLGLGSTVAREDTFKAGSGLFYFAGMINITLFRDSDTDFGILPAPKYSEAQEEYCSSYSNSNFTVYALPTTVGDAGTVGDITEIMAHLSKYTLTPAYYDQTLIGKATRDMESEPMIELILRTRNFDLGIVYDWGGVCGTIQGLTDPGVVASRLKASTKATDKILGKFIAGITESD